MLKISFLGDSITEGGIASFYHLSFVPLVEKSLPCVAYNFGISGTKIARHKPTNKDRSILEMVNRVDKIYKDSDFVFILAGVNDYWLSTVPIGKVTDRKDDTFIGALNLMLERLIHRFGKDKLAYIIPFPKMDEGPQRDGITHKSLEEYRKIIKSRCNFYHIETIDMNKDLKEIKLNFYDGAHPNDHGHQIVANNIVKFLTKKFRLGAK